MKIAVLSGKGGTGKTMVSVNLACAAANSVYIDCDVEEPNGHLFLKPENPQTQTVFKSLPTFDDEKCTGCRKCVDFCRFNALAYLKGKHKVFEDVCHFCGGCALVCPENAVGEARVPVGEVVHGMHTNTMCITGRLNIGEGSGTPVVKAALDAGFAENRTTIIDCPPGSGCSVLESVEDVDYCIIVAEPTAFGLHNMQMVHQLTALMKKPCGIVINKETSSYEPLEEYCKMRRLPILMRIPYKEDYARLCAAGEILCEKDEQAKAMFAELLDMIGGAAK